MASEWQEFLLEDLADDITVGHVGSMASEYVEDGVPFLRSLNIQPHRVVMDEIRYIRPDFHQRLRKSSLRPGDVVIVRTGKPGTCAVIPEWLPDANCSDVVIVRCGPKINNRFLSYFVNSVAAGHVAAHTVGAVQQHFNVGSARKIRIPLPSMEEQLEITSTLSALDDKIARLRETNATLEAIVQAIFKSWFVDFDPVRAKAEGRDPEGVPTEVVDMFPSEFEESELGAIPKGWRMRPIQDVIEAVFDGPHATPEESSIGPVFLGIRNFSGTQLDFSNIRHIKESDWARWTKRVLPRGGDIVFTYEAALGLFALIPDWLRCCLGRRTALVRVSEGDPARHYLFHYFTAKPFQDYLRSHTQHGSTVDRILVSEFPRYPVLWSSESLVAAFDGFAAPCWARIHQNLQQIQALAEIRDTLLPRLMSGKARLLPINSTENVSL